MNNTHWNRLIAQLPDDARYGYKELQLTETQLSDYEYVYALIADFMRSKKYEVKAYPHGLKWLLKDEAKHILEMRLSSATRSILGSNNAEHISDEGRILASSFLELFDATAVFVSGMDLAESSRAHSMVDEGVIGIDRSKIAFIWFQEEM